MSIFARSKSMAKALRKALAERHIELPHSACLEIVARQFGFSEWNVLKSVSDNEKSLSFTLLSSTAGSRKPRCSTKPRSALSKRKHITCKTVR